MPKKLDNEELLKQIKQLDGETIGGASEDDIAKQIATSLKYYYGEKFGNEKLGESSVILRIVQDVIESLMPEFMEIFAGGEKVIEFRPEGTNDIEQAKLESDFVNDFFLNDDEVQGYLVLYDYIKDTLLCKNGYCYTAPEDVDLTEREEFEGLTKDEMDFILAREDVSLVDDTWEQDKDTGLNSFAVKVKGSETRQRVEVIPPEQISIHKSATSTDDSPFVKWRSPTDKQELMKLGVKEEDIKGGDDSADNTEIPDARNSIDNTDNLPASDDLYLDLCFIRTDANGDGIEELLLVKKFKGTIVGKPEELEEMPISSMTATRIPHKHHGMSEYDMVGDIQLIASTIIRNILTNQYKMNNARLEVVEGMVNIQDALNNVPGGIVRSKMAGQVNPIPPVSLGQQPFSLLEFFEQVKTSRSGVSSRSNSLDPDLLNSNVATSSVHKVMEGAQARIKLRARLLAETGLKPMFRKLHSSLRRSGGRTFTFEQEGKFHPIDPSKFRNRNKMRIRVGLGHGSVNEKLMQHNMIIGAMERIGNSPYGQMIISPDEVYRAGIRVAEIVGDADPSRYFKNPDGKPLPQPQPNPDILLKAQAQNFEMMKWAKEHDLDVDKFLLDVEKFEWEQEKDIAEIALEASQERGVDV